MGRARTTISAIRLALERRDLCVNIPMFGISECLNLGTPLGIVRYEITKQRAEFQNRLKAKIAAKVSPEDSASPAAQHSLKLRAC